MPPQKLFELAGAGRFVIQHSLELHQALAHGQNNIERLGRQFQLVVEPHQPY